MTCLLHGGLYAVSAFLSVQLLMGDADVFGALSVLPAFAWGVFAFPNMRKDPANAICIILMSFPLIGGAVGLLFGLGASATGSLELLFIFPLLGGWTAIMAPIEYPHSQGVIYATVATMSFALSRLSNT